MRAEATQLTARPGAPLRGTARAPGDKSISHRALILGSMAHGATEIENLLEGDDVQRTAAAMAAFGAGVERLSEGRWRVEGRGGWRTPDEIVDLGNSGTGVRLVMGAAAGFAIKATFTGDISLCGRPMGRVIRPLTEMGARFEAAKGGRLPLTLRGGGLSGVRYAPPEPSAQVKSAVLLAGLNAQGVTEVVEKVSTRDHTERMLAAFGGRLTTVETPDGRVVRLAGGQRLTGASVRVPGDPSSAAFPIVAALITPGSDIWIKDVLINPLRAGLLSTLTEMGADLSFENRRSEGGEDVADIAVRHSTLKGIEVPPDRAASMIDEYPALAIAAAFAHGPTVMRGIGELRVKESDRIALTAAGLAACGVSAEEEAEGLIVHGAGGVAGGARILTGGDHRIAMSFLTLGLAAREPVTVDEAGMIATSFPNFVALMRGLGVRLEA